MALKTYPASEQGPLAPGERLFDLSFFGRNGRAVSLYDNRLFGWTKVVLAAGAPEAAEAELGRLAGSFEAFTRLETQVFAVTTGPVEANDAVAQRLGLPYPVLADPEGALLRALGRDAAAAPCTLIFDPILRLERELAGPQVENQAEAALDHVRARMARQPTQIVSAQPPALVVPAVLDAEHCGRLIRFWEEGGKIEGAVASEQAGGNVVKPQTKVRTDVIVPEDAPETAELVAVLGRRLLPEVLKGFNFRVTRVEHFRVGCYDAADGSHFAAHRDNDSRLTEYRRYALTLNLNTGEYEGGFLRFPEFGPQLYAPGAGGAVVFSCSLLHLVTPITKGRRFALLGFFYGEEEEEIRQRNNARLAAADKEPSD